MRRVLPPDQRFHQAAGWAAAAPTPTDSPAAAETLMLAGRT
jgi:hypothetical protein